LGGSRRSIISQFLGRKNPAPLNHFPYLILSCAL
jgi:hypothetical protein